MWWLDRYEEVVDMAEVKQAERGEILVGPPWRSRITSFYEEGTTHPV
jgi:hypothetical protein